MPSETGSPTQAQPRHPLASGLGLVLLAVILPLLAVGPSLLPGQRFLPFAPVQFSPLAEEHPAAARAAELGTNQWTADRLFPALTDQQGFKAAWKRGESGDWDASLGLGMPRLGNAIHGPFYPPNWIQRWVDADRTAGLLALLSLAWAGIGLGLFLRARGLGWSAVFVAVAGLEAVGFGPRNLHYGMKVDAVLWLPWAWWAIEGLARRRPWAAGALGLAVGLPFLAGFPPIAAFAWFAAASWALVRLFDKGKRTLLAAAGALALGPLLGAPQLLPTLAASHESFRQPKNAHDLALESLPLVSSLSLLLPDLYGSPQDPGETYGPAAAWWFSPVADAERVQLAQGLEWDAYAGGAALGLALVGLIASPAAALAPLAVVLAATGFAQGWPFVRWLYHVPLLSGGAPPRALSIAWIAWAWAAALGAQALLSGLRRARLSAAALGLVFLLAGGALSLWPLDPAAWTARTAQRHGRSLEEALLVMPLESQAHSLRQIERGAHWLAGAGACLLLAAALGARTRARSGPPNLLDGVSATWPCALLVLFSGAELCLATREHTHSRDLGGLAIWPTSAELDGVREAAAGGRLARIAQQHSPADLATRLARPNLPTAYGIHDLTAYVAFPPRSQVETFQALDPGSRYRSGFAGFSTAAVVAAPLLDAAGVSVVLSDAALDDPRLSAVLERPEWFVYARRGAAPRVRYVDRELSFTDREALLRAVSDSAWDPKQCLHRLGTRLGERRVPQPAAPAQWSRPTPERIEVAPAEPGLLVVSEQFAAGWSAEIDGQPVPLFEADGCFIGLEIQSPGEHLVLRYRAPGKRLGLLLCALSLISLFALERLRR